MKGRALGLGAIVVALLVAAPIATAATPEQIYNDYAANGKLDGTYSVSDLQRALKDVVLQGYGGPYHKNLKPAIRQKIVQVKSQQKKVTIPAVKKTGGLPFTGLDLALITLGGISLLLLGAGLRRFARRTS